MHLKMQTSCKYAAVYAYDMDDDSSAVHVAPFNALDHHFVSGYRLLICSNYSGNYYLASL